MSTESSAAATVDADMTTAANEEFYKSKTISIQRNRRIKDDKATTPAQERKRRDVVT